LRFALKQITPSDARAISCWRYEEPYSIYDGDPTSVDAILQPRLSCHSVYDESGDLAGYFCFGEDAQVASGKRLGLYEAEPALDVGLGMRPDLTGRGLGEEFSSSPASASPGRFTHLRRSASPWPPSTAAPSAYMKGPDSRP
jgi:[ribosomal protein S18]-alanine N-acetyltransferase